MKTWDYEAEGVTDRGSIKTFSGTVQAKTEAEAYSAATLDAWKGGWWVTVIITHVGLSGK